MFRNEIFPSQKFEMHTQIPFLKIRNEPFLNRIIPFLIPSLFEIAMELETDMDVSNLLLSCSDIEQCQRLK